MKNILALKKRSIRRLKVWYFRRHFWYRNMSYAEKGRLYLKLAWIGVATPGIPHTPFFIAAFLNFQRAGNSVMVNRIMSHPLYGGVVRDWTQNKRISWKGKLLASISIIISVALSIGVALLLNFFFDQIRRYFGVIPFYLGAVAIVCFLIRKR